jgi:plastocyanin
MLNGRRPHLWLVVAAMCFMLMPGMGASAAEEIAGITSDAATAAELGLLLGDGNGVDDAYLAKKATRLQAAIISLRLQGELSAAEAHNGTDTFSDADQVGKTNQRILAYLKAHPELGWSGIGDGTFKPLDPISAQQFYKVMLEALGYKSGTDFAYDDTVSFAAAKGLTGIAGQAVLTNGHIATALVEALAAETTAGGSFFAALQARGAIAADAVLPAREPAVGEAETEPKTYRIDIKDFSFGTEPLTVEAGATIIFTNYDEMKHNAVANDGTFETPLLAKGESYSITIDKPGTYDYVCEPHAKFMIGKIIVK